MGISLLTLVKSYLQVRDQLESISQRESELKQDITNHPDFNADTIKMLSDNQLSVSHRYPDIEAIPYSEIQYTLPHGLLNLAAKHVDLRSDLDLVQQIDVIHEVGGTITDAGELVSNHIVRLKLDRLKLKSNQQAQYKLHQIPECTEVYLPGWLLEKIVAEVNLDGELSRLNEWHANPAYSISYKKK